jgi:RNA polymerase sigma-70 factor, ECF subfamily
MTNLSSTISMKSWVTRRFSWFFIAFGVLNQDYSHDEIQENLLVSQAVKDPQAFDDLYRRYVDRIYVYHLARTSSQEEAEDLTSQTFLAALEGISGYRRQGSFAAWLFSIARRKLVDHYRLPKSVPLELAESSINNLEDAIDHRLTMQQISQALLTLAPDRMEALLLRVFGQLSAVETGLVLSKSDGAIRNLVYRALQDLRQQFPTVVEMEEE